ncbi:MAG: divergent polysaccharide deacetylase family protein [Sulfurovum sp.]|nr:divergent polysaccharide deacetylase family protein [Sulfurovum sp.]
MLKKSSNNKSSRKNSSRKPKKLSAVQKAKKEKRKRSFIYSSFVAISFVSLLGFGYYLGSQDHEKRSLDTKRVSSNKIFDGIAENKNTSKTSTVYSDKAGFETPDIISKLMKKQEERSKARREKEEQLSKNKSSKIAIKKGKRPKLAIVIDDVSQLRQIKAIKSLGYSITPSIFPPSQQAKNSHKLASGLKHFMIHLPMQSGSKKMNSMYGMLRVSDTDEKMKARAKEVRKLFPHAKFVNSHTGSVFTSDYAAMKKMYGYLRIEGFIFMDSRTAGSSKVGKIAKEFGDRYIVRDIFIDNTQSIPYIHKQLKKAVKIAKKKGYAIAIGHPHKVTFKAIASAKKIFDGVDLVYIDELYR